MDWVCGSGLGGGVGVRGRVKEPLRPKAVWVLHRKAAGVPPPTPPFPFCKVLYPKPQTVSFERSSALSPDPGRCPELQRLQELRGLICSHMRTPPEPSFERSSALSPDPGRCPELQRLQELRGLICSHMRSHPQPSFERSSAQEDAQNSNDSKNSKD